MIYVKLLIGYGFDIYQESTGSGECAYDVAVEYSTSILQYYNSAGKSGTTSHSSKSRLESSYFNIKKQEAFSEKFMLYLGCKNIFNTQNNSRNLSAPTSGHNSDSESSDNNNTTTTTNTQVVLPKGL